MSWRDTQQRLNRYGYELRVDGILGPKTYAAVFAYMGAKAAAPLLGASADLHFPDYRVNSPLRISHWLAQFGVESRSFTAFEEDLSYSADRICAVWPSRFPSPSLAAPFAHNPEALANRVYGGRMGNNEDDDGWTYRGRGPGLTGRANYAACEVRTGLPLVECPELASKPENFVLIACDFWAQHGCNEMADQDDLKGITRAINGGYNGLADRARMLTRAEAVLQ